MGEPMLNSPEHASTRQAAAAHIRPLSPAVFAAGSEYSRYRVRPHHKGMRLSKRPRSELRDFLQRFVEIGVVRHLHVGAPFLRDLCELRDGIGIGRKVRLRWLEIEAVAAPERPDMPDIAVSQRNDERDRARRMRRRLINLDRGVAKLEFLAILYRHAAFRDWSTVRIGTWLLGWRGSSSPFRSSSLGRGAYRPDIGLRRNDRCGRV